MSKNQIENNQERAESGSSQLSNINRVELLQAGSTANGGKDSTGKDSGSGVLTMTDPYKDAGAKQGGDSQSKAAEGTIHGSAAGDKASDLKRANGSENGAAAPAANGVAEAYSGKPEAKPAVGTGSQNEGSDVVHAKHYVVSGKGMAF